MNYGADLIKSILHFFFTVHQWKLIMSYDCRKCNDLGETCRICQAENQESAWSGGFDMAITVVLKLIEEADNDLPLLAFKKALIHEVEKIKNDNS